MRQLLLLLCLACGSAAVCAAELRVSVTDAVGAPVEDAVLTLHGEAAGPAPRPGVGTMDQRGLRFVPHVLVVQAGTPVDFPNNDRVRHHVYSFSEAKRFELRLYKGRPQTPVTFDKPGVVTLGCNIHDWMLGYIYIADTPWFARSDAAGLAVLDGLPPGRYTLSVWHPRGATPGPVAAGEFDLRGKHAHELSLVVRPPERSFEPPTGLDARLKGTDR